MLWLRFMELRNYKIFTGCTSIYTYVVCNSVVELFRKKFWSQMADGIKVDLHQTSSQAFNINSRVAGTYRDMGTLPHQFLADTFNPRRLEEGVAEREP